MAEKKNNNVLGGWAFLIGVLLALISGIFSGLDIANLSTPLMTGILIVIGLLVGILNISAKESMPFLFSGLALIIASVFGVGITGSIAVVSSTLMALLTIFVPATIIVAIRNVFSLAKN